MTHFRTFRNTDPPALTRLWNRGAAPSASARPLSVHEFDSHVLGRPLFDAAGLIVAERDGRPVGFVHAGFGPETDADAHVSRPMRLSRELGTVSMLIVDPPADDPGLEADLLAAGEDYLRRRGAVVVYAGGQYPLNPFYWGIYGGSEWAGVLSSHAPFLRAIVGAGYEAVGTTVLMELDLGEPEVRDPRAVLFRRQTVLEVTEDVTPRTWWDNLAVGEFRPTLYRLIARDDQSEVARATTWDMSWFGRIDNRTRLGLVDVEVRTDRRRKGLGRHLLNEILRQARAQQVGAVSVQTPLTNSAALAFYESLGFQPFETSTLFRLPGGRPAAPDLPPPARAL